MSYEVFEDRELVQEGGAGYWYGRRTWICGSGQAGSISRALFNSVWTDAGGSAPICKKTRATWLPGGIPGLAMVQAFYSTARQPGKAHILTRTRAQWEKILREPEGEKRIIEGPDPTIQNAEWIVVKGDNVVQTFDTEIIIQTAYPANKFNLVDILSLKGSVNSAALRIPKLGTIPAEKALLAGVGTSWEYGQGLMDVNYHLLYSGPDETWNQKVRSRMGTWVVEEMPVFSSSSSSTTSTKPALVFKAGKKLERTAGQSGAADSWRLLDTAEEDRRCFAKKNYARYLSGLTEW